MLLFNKHTHEHHLPACLNSEFVSCTRCLKLSILQGNAVMPSNQMLFFWRYVFEISRVRCQILFLHCSYARLAIAAATTAQLRLRSLSYIPCIVEWVAVLCLISYAITAYDWRLHITDKYMGKMVPLYSSTFINGLGYYTEWGKSERSNWYELWALIYVFKLTTFTSFILLKWALPISSQTSLHKLSKDLRLW